MLSDVSKPLKQELLDHAPQMLEEGGFRIVDDGYDSVSFGNSYVTLDGPFFRLQLSRDRGEIYGQIASLSEPDTWWDLYWVTEMISGASDPDLELDSVCGLIRNHLSLLSELFGSSYPKTKKELMRREEKRKKEMFRKYSR